MEFLKKINSFVLIYFRPRATSWFLSTLLIALGIIIITATPESMSTATYLTQLLKTFPKILWGLILLTLGLIRFISLVVWAMHKPTFYWDRARVLAGMISVYIWAQMEINDPTTGMERSFRMTVRFWILMMELWNVAVAIVDL